MKEIFIEVLVGKRWTKLGSVVEGLPGGSMSSEDPDGRQVYHFGWIPELGGPAVWGSDGIDVEAGVGRHTVGKFTKLHDFTPETPTFQFVWRRPSGQEIPVRLRIG